MAYGLGLGEIFFGLKSFHFTLLLMYFSILRLSCFITLFDLRPSSLAKSQFCHFFYLSIAETFMKNCYNKNNLLFY